MWSLHKIKLFSDDRVLTHCQENLEFIGEGTGRRVFAISDDLVIKVAYNIAGRRQNETEWTLKDNEICANIYQHHKEFLWVVMDRLIMYEDDGELEELTGSTFHDKMVWCEYHQFIELNTISQEYKDGIRGRLVDKVKICGDEWVERMRTSPVVCNLLNFIINNNMETGDLSRTTSWGYIKGDKDKPLIFDYGLSHKVWTECYSRRYVKTANDLTVRLVEVVGHESRVGEDVKVWIDGHPEYYEIVEEVVGDVVINGAY